MKLEGNKMEVFEWLYCWFWLSLAVRR